MANGALRWFALILVSKIRLYLTESESNGGGAGKIRIDVAAAPFATHIGRKMENSGISQGQARTSPELPWIDFGVI